MSEKITIEQGFSDEDRLSAAELYDAAFGTKLAIAIPDPNSRVAILKAGFAPQYAFVAICESELVGIAGYGTSTGSLTGEISLSLLRKTLGIWGTLRAAVVLTLFQRERSADQLLMDGISVSPSMRGRGIGTKLLHSLIDYARDEGYQTVRLDVIDTNPAAQRLYERLGFQPVKTEQFGYLKWLLGFSGTTQMEYNLDIKPHQD